MDNNQIKCQIVGHKESYIQLICVSKNCRKMNKLICLNCLGDHQSHINELIQIGNLENQITSLRCSIKLRLQIIEQDKQQLLKNISHAIEKHYLQLTKELNDFDNILLDYLAEQQTYGIAKYQNLTYRLGQNCQMDINRNQTQSFLQLKQSIHNTKITKFLQQIFNFIQKSNNSITQEVNYQYANIPLEPPQQIKQLMQPQPTTNKNTSDPQKQDIKPIKQVAQNSSQDYPFRCMQNKRNIGP